MENGEVVITFVNVVCSARCLQFGRGKWAGL